ncbi:Hypothetical protein A7982_06080 [Minicystis rosea]|nr:Hypothetical protein A7982_06080 [Minicystis rosea]
MRAQKATPGKRSSICTNTSDFRLSDTIRLLPSASGDGRPAT